MTKQNDSTILECGVDLLDLVEQISDDRPATDPGHQAACSFCQEALCRLRTASKQLRELAGEKVRVPRGLARRVMEQLRRERGRVPLTKGLAGNDTISDLVVVQIVRRAARSVDGVRQCSVTLQPEVADGELSLVVHLTALLGPSLPGLADEVRAKVVEEVASITGLRAGDISVVIDDVDLPT